MSNNLIDNPFADPFADPAIDQVTNAPTTATVTPTPIQPTQINLQASTNTSVAPPPPATTSAPMNNTTTSSNNNNNNNNNSVTVNMDNAKKIQQELERRQQELEIKAAELAAREEALRSANFQRQHNWPPLPAFCPVKPCFYQDINVDIQPEFQATVQYGYRLWLAFVGVITLNFLAGLTVLMHGVPNGGSNFSFALFAFILFVPLSYVAWFRPLYRAFKKDSSFNFMVFFFTFFLQTFITTLWSIGIPTDGPCGLWLALSQMGTGFLVTPFLFIVTGAWISYAAASVWFLLRVHRIYRSTGASLAKARTEFAEGIIRNQYVQQTVATAARQTVNQTFANATGAGQQQSTTNSNSASGVRY